ncbi:MAG: transcription-repair coupling factor [Prochlorotrichaceae cyanobacterium]|jgi:transcription-repair coupling factor (superfamily II helicase)
MALSSILRYLSQSALTQDLVDKLAHGSLRLTGADRFARGLVASTLAQYTHRPLLVITATLEEAGRWAAQLEPMGWNTVHFYPTAESSPYDPFDSEAEMLWGQMQVLSELLVAKKAEHAQRLAIVCTERALQFHLPPPSQLRDYSLHLKLGTEVSLTELGKTLTRLGYDRCATVEMEGQWSQRGDILDIFPVASELPVRLELFGDELERLREFDPATQRSLDAVPELVLTPTSFSPLIQAALLERSDLELEALLSPEDLEKLLENQAVEGVRRFLGLAYDRPATLLDYLPSQTMIAWDEPEQCLAHADRWWEHVEEQWQELRERGEQSLPKVHRPLTAAVDTLQSFPLVQLAALHSQTQPAIEPVHILNLSSRPIAAIPNQFAKMAESIRAEQRNRFGIWLISAQPSRMVSLLQEHDCTAQFVPNPRDYPAMDKLQIQHTPIAVKYSGLAELAGFILPTFRLMVVTDREFFGQHTLATPSYVRKRRRAASKQVDANQLKPGDYVVHRNHGLGQFLRLEPLTINGETREYLVLQYADGLLRVVADQVGSLSRYRATSEDPPTLNKMTGKVWEKAKEKAKKAIRKVAVDLLKLYAERSKRQGFAFPLDQPWQQELEESFPYQPTPDQLKAVADVKRDMEGERPMDRLVCGDVGFGKTEVAIRALFKAITSGKQAALLAPTTILTQQHYHTLKERFAPYPIQVGLLNRFRSTAEKKDILQRLATGELDVVVGTHQLLGKTVKFKDLGLLVVDEEQRFGVNQKEKIKALKTEVDVLTLSATPIPRTLYMSLSGVREMSLITTPPPSRRPIKTHLSPYDPEMIRTAIAQELDRGGQIFYVVPRVEGIEEVAAKIQLMLPTVRLAIAHGQMDEGSLESTMLAFSNGEADVMVCTTIIESGLDIPRVNTILIEDAHRFGLSQLYQLRGRVGRSGIQAHAWLFFPDQRLLTDTARERLRAIQEFTQLGSGFQLAMRDMEIRGVGNLLGVEQSGQLEAIGFDLYMELLEECLNEVRGQEIPKVDETQVDLALTAFIPADYMPNLEDKMAAYRTVATVKSKEELTEIAADWNDRYGPIPAPAQQLLRVMELKQVAKTVGFSRIKVEAKQHICLETPMEEPAWTLMSEKLPKHLQSRFIYQGKKVIVRGLGVLPVSQQMDNLIEWLGHLQGALPSGDEIDLTALLAKG